MKIYCETHSLYCVRWITELAHNVHSITTDGADEFTTLFGMSSGFRDNNEKRKPKPAAAAGKSASKFTRDPILKKCLRETVREAKEFSLFFFSFSLFIVATYACVINDLELIINIGLS